MTITLPVLGQPRLTPPVSICIHAGDWNCDHRMTLRLNYPQATCRGGHLPAECCGCCNQTATD